MRVLAIWLAAALAFAACAPAAPAPGASPTVKVATDAKLGKILVAANGKTLYAFAADTANTSACYDACAQNWSPLTIASGEPVAPADLKGKLATASRRDGSRQITHNGRPLYFFVGDQKAGDATGEGISSFGGTWSVVKDP